MSMCYAMQKLVRGVRIINEKHGYAASDIHSRASCKQAFDLPLSIANKNEFF